MRNIFYRDDSFSFEYTVDESGNPVLHCDVFEWKLSTLKKMYKEFASFLQLFKGKTIYTISPNPKFVSLFGGRTVSVLTVDGKEYEVIVWD